jgi:hypothetical protein
MKCISIMGLAALLGLAIRPADGQAYGHGGSSSPIAGAPASGDLLAGLTSALMSKLEPTLQTSLASAPSSTALPVIIEYHGNGLPSYVHQATASGIDASSTLGVINGCSAWVTPPQLQALCASSRVRAGDLTDGRLAAYRASGLPEPGMESAATSLSAHRRRRHRRARPALVSPRSSGR